MCQATYAVAFIPRALARPRPTRSASLDPSAPDLCENRLMSGGMDLVVLRELVGGVLNDWPGLVRSGGRKVERSVLATPAGCLEEVMSAGLGVFVAGAGGCGRYFEGEVAVDLTPAEPAQRAVADVISPRLRQAGAELRETG